MIHYTREGETLQWKLTLPNGAVPFRLRPVALVYQPNATRRYATYFSCLHACLIASLHVVFSVSDFIIRRYTITAETVQAIADE